MGDFLTNLVARIEGSAEFVRPRTPSMFEPARLPTAATGASDFEQMSDSPGEDAVPDKIHEIESTPPQDLRRPRTPRISARSEEPISRSEINQARGDTGAMSGSPVVGARFQSHATALEADADHPIQSGQVRTLVRAPAARDSVEPPESDSTHSRTIDPVKTSASAELAVSPYLARSRTQSMRADIGVSAVSGSDPSPSQNAADTKSARSSVQPISPAPLRDAIEYPIDRDYSRANKSASLGRGASAEPIVQVSIGRIEIRAVAGEAPTLRKNRAASPVMSLDEYLRQRAKGAAR